MIRNLLLVIAIILPGFLIAQPDDTTKEVHRMMIISFFDHNYLCDANHELVDANEASAEEISDYFRSQLTNYIAGAFAVKKFKRGNIWINESDSIYDYLGYRYDTPVKKRARNEGLGLRIPVIFNKDRKEDQEVYEQYSGLAGKQAEYVSIRVLDETVLDKISSRHSIDNYLFINQFEVITNFGPAQNRATNDYTRLFKVHYSYTDKEGRSISGNVITFELDDNTSDLEEMIESSFPAIAAAILADIDR